MPYAQLSPMPAMAKMKAGRGPYSDPRDTFIARTIRYAFESSRGNPLSTGQLVKEIYGRQLRVERKPLRSWHYQNVAGRCVR
jgi:hypothetical protein